MARFAGGGRRRAPAALPLRTLALLVVALGVAGRASAVAPAPTQESGGALEQFEAVDPYTKGDPEKMRELGYVSFGPFYWAGGVRTDAIRETLGGIPILFVETAHFRLASTLETYEPIGDRVEKERLDAQIEQLDEKLRVRAPRQIDPWLRLHLYAQLLEDLYADFCERFGIRDDEFTDLATKSEAGGPFLGEGPYLGQPEKFTVFLSGSTSAYGRFVRAYFQIEDDYAHRLVYPDSYLFAASFEAHGEAGRTLDVALQATTAASVIHNLVDAFRQSLHAPPTWFAVGLCHWYSRRVDPRWAQWGAGGQSSIEDELWVWEPRVWGLVKNEACPSWDEMMRWGPMAEIRSSDHMIAWARVDWLLDQKSKDLRALLFALSERLPPEPEKRAAASYEQQRAAFQSIWKADPAAMDGAWRKWVLREYRKK